MIHTSRQLKALVRNKSGGNSAKAQAIIRAYAMERFLERLSLSPYRDKLIMKGGVLVSSIAGLTSRTTLDIDATVKGLPLSQENIKRVVNDIASVPLDDGMVFSINSVAMIMDEADYPGIRVIMDTAIEAMRTPLKIDFSTDDIITPGEVVHQYRLMFEDRSIAILAYNLETVLAEKMETLLSRGVTNTRMRDFYDIYILEPYDVDVTVLRDAFTNTVAKREAQAVVGDAERTLVEVETDRNMDMLWERYRRKFDFAADVSWADAISAAWRLYARITGMK
jgi:predicted nucleotidyltransferase component of viral defense system